MEQLGQRIRAIGSRAAARGALVTLPTEKEVVTDAGIPFVVHVTRLQENKGKAKAEQLSRLINPFLPPDPELVIGDVAPAHTAVLNKFNVITEHLLIVTREFEPQERLLTLGDVQALASCMGEIDGLGFYNGGTIAGASQAHKHLQLIPLPIGAGPAATPLDTILDVLPAVGETVILDALGFPHALISLGNRRITPARADELHRLYRRACTAMGIIDDSRPYNLLVTRRWMLVVPRHREFWQRVSINALGFAGSLLVRNRDELASLKATGPLNVLRSVVGNGAGS
jgi:ATP adenylyltransferase